MSDDLCPVCGGSGWIPIRTRGMCGIDCDFDEVEEAPCDVCGVAADLKVQASRD